MLAQGCSMYTLVNTAARAYLLAQASSVTPHPAAAYSYAGCCAAVQVGQARAAVTNARASHARPLATVQPRTVGCAASAAGRPWQYAAQRPAHDWAKFSCWHIWQMLS